MTNVYHSYGDRQRTWTGRCRDGPVSAGIGPATGDLGRRHDCRARRGAAAPWNRHVNKAEFLEFAAAAAPAANFETLDLSDGLSYRLAEGRVGFSSTSLISIPKMVKFGQRFDIAPLV